MPAYHKWLRRHVIIDVPMHPRQEAIYLLMLAHIMHEYQKYSPSFQFQDVEYIRVVDGPVSENVAGLATRRHITLSYHGLSGVDSLLAAHELLHTFFFTLFNGIDGGKADAINLVHYPANAGGKYVKEKTITYASYLDRFKGKRERIRIFYYDVNEILKDQILIRALILNDKAPEGPNDYVKSY